jgi:hypothetical protein
MFATQRPWRRPRWGRARGAPLPPPLPAPNRSPPPTTAAAGGCRRCSTSRWPPEAAGLPRADGGTSGGDSHGVDGASKGCRAEAGGRAGAASSGWPGERPAEGGNSLRQTTGRQWGSGMEALGRRGASRGAWPGRERRAGAVARPGASRPAAPTCTPRRTHVIEWYLYDLILRIPGAAHLASGLAGPPTSPSAPEKDYFCPCRFNLNAECAVVRCGRAGTGLFVGTAPG